MPGDASQLKKGPYTNDQNDHLGKCEENGG